MKPVSMPRLALCAVLVLTAVTARAQLDGTLFTQPEEREYLNYLREEFMRNNAEEGFDIAETAIPEIPTDAVIEPSGPTELSFGGVMTRRDASRSVWLNGRLLEESNLPEGISLLDGERSPSLRVAFQGKAYVLRPGQTVDLTTGSVVENFQRSALAPAPGALPAQPTSAPEDTRTETASAAETEVSNEASAAASPALQAEAGAAALQDNTDPVSPLAAAIMRLTPEQSNELAARLNDQAEAANTEPESESDDAED